MSLTLIEVANNILSREPLKAGYIQMYAAGADIFNYLPFRNISGSAIRFSQQHTLPGVGFRGVNEAYPESTGSSTPVIESLCIAGGDIDVDKFETTTNGQAIRTQQERDKVTALALSWARSFIKGDQSTNPKELNGLQSRIAGNQLIAAGAAAGGDALSLAKVDEAIDACAGPTALAMNKAMRRKFTTASRNPAVGGTITYTVDSFGRQVTKYNDLPIIIFDEDNEDNLILDFNEANPGGGANVGTSIYVLSIGASKLTGIQSSIPDVRDLGELDGKAAERTRVEWYSGLTVFNPKAAIRIWGIKNAAIVA